MIHHLEGPGFRASSHYSSLIRGVKIYTAREKHLTTLFHHHLPDPREKRDMSEKEGERADIFLIGAAKFEFL